MFIEQMNEELLANMGEQPKTESADLASMGFRVQRGEGILSEDYDESIHEDIEEEGA